MAIRFDKLTVKTQEAIQRAMTLASENGNPDLQPAHILAALLEDQEGIVVPVLEKVGAGPQQVLAAVNAILSRLPKVSGAAAAQPQLSNAASQLFDQAFKEADNFKDEYVSTEHLLLAAAKQKGELQQILKNSGATYDAILKALTTVRGSQRVTDQNPEG